MDINNIYNMNCLDGLRMLENECIDLTITSPPYDDLRAYEGYEFNFEEIAKELFRVTKKGGVVVWIVNDKTIKGSESGSSFKQALYFKEVGFRLHDTMIWQKDTMSFPDVTRYGQCFEYMFILSKGKPKTINKIRDRVNKCFGDVIHGTTRKVTGETIKKSNDGKNTVQQYGERFNIWTLPTEKKNKTGHPAVFPKHIPHDHIITWSNENDIVMDICMGRGTTIKTAKELNRQYIGFEISENYFNTAINYINK